MEIPELQRVIRGLAGVATATMRWPDPDGPITLRVEFAPDADREDVTRRVLETLRQSGAIDVGTIEVRSQPVERPEPEQEPVSEPVGEPAAPPVSEPVSEPAAAAVGPAARGRRPALVGMHVSWGGIDTAVQVILEFAERRVSGHADGVSAAHGDLRAAANATLSAVRHLLPGNIRLDLDWLDVTLPASGPGDTAVVQARVNCLTPADQVRQFYGSAPIGDDARLAAARATLDALNRWMSPLVTAP